MSNFWPEIPPDETVTVYRVENAGGFGPYCKMDSDTVLHHNFANGHPSPIRTEEPFDPNVYMKQGHPGVNESIMFFGFESLKKLGEWFTAEEILKLAHEGFYVCSYRVKRRNVIYGRKQLCFVKCRAKHFKRELSYYETEIKTAKEPDPMVALARVTM
jgi:hypothetical protein